MINVYILISTNLTVHSNVKFKHSNKFDIFYNKSFSQYKQIYYHARNKAFMTFKKYINGLL